MANLIGTAGKAVGKYLGSKVVDNVLKPVDGLIDQNLADIATTFGSFVIRAVRGKFQRSITFEVGLSYYDSWLEVALYGILYEWNNIKASSKLEYQVKRIGASSSQEVYYRLGDGFHNLKYRDWDIMLAVQTKSPTAPGGRIMPVTMYTIISYDLSPEFVKCFEQDMLRHRNSILKISSDNPMLNVYKDMHESDGYTYWEKMAPVYKRKLSTIYLPREQKKLLVNTINEFFAMKQFYIDHGIPHNLKILLHGPAGSGKAQPLSTPIPTPTGFKLMGDLKVGDYVFTDDGSPTEIIGVYPQGVKDVYEITFSDGRTAECSLDHLWKVKFVKDGQCTEWNVLTLADIIDLQHTLYRDWDVIIPTHRGIITVDGISHTETCDELTIVDIMYQRRRECQCIRVASPSHLYITDQYIVTHNTSIVKMIASEWNRNLYECTGGKNGKFIPNAITDYDEGIISPLFSISDIDKYPTLINEADTDMTDKTENKTDEQLAYRQQFNNMINALDGITSGDDRIIVMTTNHIEKFSETFLRPGRTDLKMEIGYVIPEVFRKYTFDFYGVELPKDIKLSRDNIVVSEMQFDVVNMKLSADEFIKKYVS